MLIILLGEESALIRVVDRLVIGVRLRLGLLKAGRGLVVVVEFMATAALSNMLEVGRPTNSL